MDQHDTVVARGWVNSFFVDIATNFSKRVVSCKKTRGFVYRMCFWPGQLSVWRTKEPSSRLTRCSISMKSGFLHGSAIDRSMNGISNNLQPNTSPRDKPEWHAHFDNFMRICRRRVTESLHHWKAISTVRWRSNCPLSRSQQYFYHSSKNFAAMKKLQTAGLSCERAIADVLFQKMSWHD